MRDLVEEWRAKSDEFEAAGYFSGATLCRSHADQLEARLDDILAEMVGIPEAAAISGYNAEWLRQLVRAGKLQATKRNGRTGSSPE